MEPTEPTKFEKEFGVDLSSKSLDIINGIDIGMKIERRGMEFYREQASKTINDAIKKFFEFMAGEENEHLKLLSELKVSLMEKKMWTDLNYTPPKKPDEFFHKSEQSELDAMMAAMRTEKDTVDFYHRFSQAIDDEKGKDFFRKLAEWEQTHYNLINAVFEQSTEFRMES